MAESVKSKRIGWVDYAKGLAILFVMAGHTYEGFAMDYIRSVPAVPIFFILAGITVKPVEWKDFLKSVLVDAKRLLLPYVISVFFYRLYINIISGFTLPVFLKDYILSLYGASVVAYEDPKLGTIPFVFAAWFFVCFFFAREIFKLLLKVPVVIRLVVVVLLSAWGVILGQTTHLPFLFNNSLCALLYMECGYIIKTYREGFEKYKWIFGLVGLAVCILIPITGYMVEMPRAIYPLGIASLYTSIGHSLFFIVLFIYLEKTFLRKPITYLGTITMPVLCVHIMDVYFSKIYQIDGIFSNTATIAATKGMTLGYVYFWGMETLMFAIRMVIDIGLAMLYLKIKNEIMKKFSKKGLSI